MIIVSPGVLALLSRVFLEKADPLSWPIDTFGLFIGFYFIVCAFLVIWDTAEYRREMGGKPGSRSVVLRLFSRPYIRILFPFMSQYEGRKKRDVIRRSGGV